MSFWSRLVLAGFISLLALAHAAGSRHQLNISEVSPTYETDAVTSSGDAADDAAIWLDETDASRSLIVGTDKQGYLLIYSLQGKELSEQLVGRINNIDSRTGVKVHGTPSQVFVGSNRSTSTVDFFIMETEGPRLNKIGSIPVDDEPYGICLGREPSGAAIVFVTSQSGPVQKFLVEFAEAELKFQNLGKISFKSTTEGCVVDEVNSQVFIGEESRGVWRFSLDSSLNGTLVDRTGSEGNLKADVEGIAIHRSATGDRLVVSSQGNDSFHVYDLSTLGHVGAFRIGQSQTIDNVTDTDGIEIMSGAVNSDFPEGFLIAQDGINFDSQGRYRQNFKIVDWRNTANVLRK